MKTRSPLHRRLLPALVVASVALAVLFAEGSAARTTVTKMIVVNSKADAPDAKPKDGVCKAKFTMLTTPGKIYCTLRAAIQTADFGPRGTYLIKLPAGTFHLSVKGRGENNAAKGDLDLNQANLTLAGAGPQKTTIDASGIDRVLDEPYGFASATVRDLRIRGGSATDGPGGGGVIVRGGGVLTLERVVLDSNVATGVNDGGGVYVGDNSSALLTEVALTHNVADQGAGAQVTGKAKLTNVTFFGNNSGTGGGGLRITDKGTANLAHVTFAGNTGPLATAIGADGLGFGMEASVVQGTCYFGTQTFPGSRNVVSNSSCPGLAVADVGLTGQLTVSGNGVPTDPLKATSPAVDFAFPNSCPATDARGVKRPQGAACDAGAFELVKP